MAVATQALGHIMYIYEMDTELLHYIKKPVGNILLYMYMYNIHTYAYIYIIYIYIYIYMYLIEIIQNLQVCYLKIYAVNDDFQAVLLINFE